MVVNATGEGAGAYTFTVRFPGVEPMPEPQPGPGPEPEPLPDPVPEPTPEMPPDADCFDCQPTPFSCAEGATISGALDNTCRVRFGPDRVAVDWYEFYTEGGTVSFELTGLQMDAFAALFDGSCDAFIASALYSAGQGGGAGCCELSQSLERGRYQLAVHAIGPAPDYWT